MEDAPAGPRPTPSHRACLHAICPVRPVQSRGAGSRAWRCTDWIALLGPVQIRVNRGSGDVLFSEGQCDSSGDGSAGGLCFFLHTFYGSCCPGAHVMTGQVPRIALRDALKDATAVSHAGSQGQPGPRGQALFSWQGECSTRKRTSGDFIKSC